MQTQTPIDGVPLMRAASPALIPAGRPRDVHDGELLLPDDEAVELIAAPDPFGTTVIRRNVTAGQTIAEMIDAVQPVAEKRRVVNVWLCRYGDDADLVYVPAENWHLVRPKPGVVVTIRIAPEGGGGGKNPLRIVMSIAVLAASIVIPGLPAVAAALGSTGAAFLGVGIASSGTLLVSARKPPQVAR